MIAMPHRWSVCDQLHPLFNRLLRQNLPSPPELPRPWHWDYYMLREAPRPEFQADFDRRYAAGMEEARGALKAQTSRPKK